MKLSHALSIAATMTLVAPITATVAANPLTPASPSIGEEKDGWALFRKRDYSAALKRFEREAKKYPQWAELHDAMGWCHYFLGDLDKADKRFREALKHKEDYKWSLEGLEALTLKRSAPIDAAGALLSAGLYTEAKAAYQRIHEGKTDAGSEARYAAHCGEGWSLFYLGEIRSALRSFRKANKLNKSDADSLRGIGWCEYAQLDYRRSLTALQLSLDLAPNHYYTHLKRGWAHYYLGDYDSALKSFQTAQSQPSITWDAWAGSGWCYLQMEDEDSALAEFSKAVRISPYAKTTQLTQAIEARPTWRGLHNVAGWSALDSSLDAWALAEFEYSEQLGYDVAESLMGQTFALFRMERYDEALQHEEQATAIEGTGGTRAFPVTTSTGEVIEVRMNLMSVKAWIAYRQGRYDEALALFRKLKTSHTNWVDVRCGEGWVLYAQGNYPAAEKAFEGAAQLSPSYPDAISGQQAVQTWRYYDYNRGWTLLLAGDLAGAKQVFQSIQEDSRKSFPRDRMELIEASLGWVASWSGERRTAIQHFETALGLRADLGLAERGWGELLLAEEEWDRAARHLQAALKSKELQGSADTYVSLGLALMGNRQLEEAEVAFDKAIELGPTLAAAYRGQALLHLRNRDRVDARIALERAISFDPTVADDEVIRKKINGTPELHRLHSVLGWAWYYRSNYEKALSEFEFAIERDPLETSALQGKGFALLNQKRVDEGRKILEEFLKGAPRYEDPWGKWSTTLSTLAWALYADEQYNKASKVFRRLLALHKGQKLAYADPHDGLGWCYLRERKERQAKKAFTQALEISPTYANSLSGLKALEQDTSR